MTPQRFFLLTLSLFATLSADGCRTSGSTRTSADWTKQQAQEMRLAGERLGVPIRTESIVQFAQGGAAVVIATAANLETTPATRYPGGVDLGVSYIEGPVSAQDSTKRIPNGFYKLRVFADEARRVGKVGGHVQLINASGRNVAEWPADVEIRSLTLPQEASTQNTVVTVNSENPISAAPNGNPGHVVHWCVRCPNGAWSCWSYLSAE